MNRFGSGGLSSGGLQSLYSLSLYFKFTMQASPCWQSESTEHSVFRGLSLLLKHLLTCLNLSFSTIICPLLSLSNSNVPRQRFLPHPLFGSCIVCRLSSPKNLNCAGGFIEHLSPKDTLVSGGFILNLPSETISLFLYALVTQVIGNNLVPDPLWA